MTTLMKVLWGIAVVGFLIGAFAVYSVLGTQKQVGEFKTNITEFKTGNAAIDQRLTAVESKAQEASRLASNAAELSAKTSEAHNKFAASTNETLTNQGLLIKQNSADIIESKKKFSDLESQTDKHRVSAAAAEKKAADAFDAMERLRKGSEEALKERRSRPDEEKSARAVETVEKLRKDLEAFMRQDASGTANSVSDKTAAAPAVSPQGKNAMMRVGNASSQKSWKSQELIEGLESVTVSIVGKPDGWVAVEGNGRIEVINHIRLRKEGMFNDEYRQVVRQINARPGVALPVFNETEKISIKPLDGPAVFWWREK